MIDSVDLKKIINTVIQPNIKIIMLLIFLFILIVQFLQVKVVISLFLIVFVFIFYNDILNTINTIQKNETVTEKIIENNKREKKELNFDDEINNILHKFHKYRKYNSNAHDEGYRYIKMFMFIIHDLEKDDIAHPKQYFENAEIYLEKSLNNFQSISISVPEENFNNSLKYNKFEPTKLGNRIGKLCKRLHKHCYYLLFNLSQRFNEDWIQNPDIYKTEITMNSDNVKAIHDIDFNWDYY
jgi:hypothetical protein